MSKTIIRPMVPEDRRGFIDLTARRPGFDRIMAERRTEVIWHIAFGNPTSDGAPTYFVATDGDRLLCHMGRMPTWFFVEGRRHLAAFAHDLFAHPDLQASGAGFFVTMKLYKTVEDTCRSFCGLLWTNDINIKLQQARKYDQLWVRRWVRPLDADRLIRDKLRVLPAPAKALACAGGRLAIGLGDLALRSVRSGARTEVVFHADERFDAFAEEVGPRLGTAPVKDRAYVDWRYLSWPHLRARVIVVPDGTRKIRGFAVLREPEADDEPGRILDLMAAPEDDAAFHGLIAEALRHYRARRVPIVETMATSPPLIGALSRFFFVQRLPDKPLFFLNGNKYEHPEHLRRLETWHHSFGDSEGGEVP